MAIEATKFASHAGFLHRRFPSNCYDQFPKGRFGAPIWNHRLLLEIIMLSANQFAIAIAAPIAAAIAILGVVVVRGTKITEFRQAWINAQRDDLAIIVANARRLMRNATGDKLFEAWLALDAAMVRVRLRRNPNVTWYRRLLRRNRVEWLDVIPELDALEGALRASPTDTTAAETALTNIVDRSAPHLKREWNRTRNGELGFRIYITLAPALILSPLIVAIGWLLDRWLGLGWLPNVPFVDTLPLPPT